MLEVVELLNEQSHLFVCLQRQRTPSLGADLIHGESYSRFRPYQEAFNLLTLTTCFDAYQGDESCLVLNNYY